MFVHKYQPCPVSISLDYAGPQVSVAVIIVTIIAVVYCCVLQQLQSKFDSTLSEHGECISGRGVNPSKMGVLTMILNCIVSNISEDLKSEEYPFSAITLKFLAAQC